MATGVVVGKDDGGTLASQGFCGYFTRIDRGLRQGAAKQFDHFQNTVLAVQKDSHKDFVGAICQQQLQVVAHGVGGDHRLGLPDFKLHKVEGLLHQRRALVGGDLALAGRCDARGWFGGHGVYAFDMKKAPVPGGAAELLVKGKANGRDDGVCQRWAGERMALFIQKTHGHSCCIGGCPIRCRQPVGRLADQ